MNNWNAGKSPTVSSDWHSENPRSWNCAAGTAEYGTDRAIGLWRQALAAVDEAAATAAAGDADADTLSGSRHCKND